MQGVLPDLLFASCPGKWESGMETSVTNCLLFSGIKNRERAPGMALTLRQIWLAAALITLAPVCFPESSGEADGQTASPVVLKEAELTTMER